MIAEGDDVVGNVDADADADAEDVILKEEVQ